MQTSAMEMRREGLVMWHFCDIANYVNEDGYPRRTGHWRTNAARFAYAFTASFTNKAKRPGMPQMDPVPPGDIDRMSASAGLGSEQQSRCYSRLVR